jgi:hypothetical protein
MLSTKDRTILDRSVRITFKFILNCPFVWLDHWGLMTQQGWGLQVWAWPFFHHPTAARTSTDPLDQ